MTSGRRPPVTVSRCTSAEPWRQSSCRCVTGAGHCGRTRVTPCVFHTSPSFAEKVTAIWIIFAGFFCFFALLHCNVFASRCVPQMIIWGNQTKGRPGKVYFSYIIYKEFRRLEKLVVEGAPLPPSLGFSRPALPAFGKISGEVFLTHVLNTASSPLMRPGIFLSDVFGYQNHSLGSFPFWHMEKRGGNACEKCNVYKKIAFLCLMFALLLNHCRRTTQPGHYL